MIGERTQWGAKVGQYRIAQVLVHDAAILADDAGYERIVAVNDVNHLLGIVAFAV